MNQDKIIPSLWFFSNGSNLANIVKYYKNIFNDNLEEVFFTSLGDTPSGKAEMGEIKIFGQKYSLMCTEKEHNKFNDAFALTINCKDQEEIDKYWNYFTKDGVEVQCGWCIDKYGLRWQVLPSNFGELMSRPNAWQVMMSQKKIVIDEY